MSLTFETQIDYFNTETNTAQISLLFGNYVVYSVTETVFGMADINDLEDKLAERFVKEFRQLIQTNKLQHLK